MEKQLGWACKLGGVESMGTSNTSQTVLATLMESQIWQQPPGCWLSGVWAQKRDNGLCSPLMADASASPSVPLMPFKLPPRHWSSEGESLSR